MSLKNHSARIEERELEEGSKEGGERRGKGATGGKERGRRMVWQSTEVLSTL